MKKAPSTNIAMRRGFSLLEVIIATAVLAGSAMVLVSMIGVGSRFGQQAERRTLALAAASSLLDELIATNDWDNNTPESTGVFGANDPLGYRIRVFPFSPQAANQSEPIAGLQQITVEVFSSEIRASDVGQKPLCALTRIIRIPASNKQAETR